MVSIIIPVYNQHEITAECIRAVADTTEGCEIIVIDNGSDPAIKPPFCGFTEIRTIRNEENLGFPKAVNQGIRTSNGDVIILLNNDVIVTPDWAKLLVEKLDEYSIIGPCTNYVAGKQRANVGLYEDIDGLNKEAVLFTQENLGETESVNWVIGFCMAFKKSLYDELGEFDESLWPCSGEEIDFCFRARNSGHKVGIARDVYVHHEGSQTFKDMEKSGVIKYEDVCKASDANIASRWGKDFWQRQVA